MAEKLRKHSSGSADQGPSKRDARCVWRSLAEAMAQQTTMKPKPDGWLAVGNLRARPSFFQPQL